MKTDPGVMEIFFRSFGGTNSAFAQRTLELPRLGMEESAIIQRLDHMQARIPS